MNDAAEWSKESTVNMLEGWPCLEQEVAASYFQDLMATVDEEYRNQTVYPDRNDIFRALEWTPFEQVKVVILGQDPYHRAGQAHGLSFSVQPGVTPPPSLVNIYKELEADIGMAPPLHGHLKKWATEGVLMLNTILTVREGEPLSHKSFGWEIFTDAVIRKLSGRQQPIAFILWGKPAQAKKKLIADHHLILQSAHPSPLSAYRGFLGSKPFSQVNDWLLLQGRSTIDWRLN